MKFKTFGIDVPDGTLLRGFSGLVLAGKKF